MLFDLSTFYPKLHCLGNLNVFSKWLMLCSIYLWRCTPFVSVQLKYTWMLVYWHDTISLSAACLTKLPTISILDFFFFFFHLLFQPWNGNPEACKTQFTSFLSLQATSLFIPPMSFKLACLFHRPILSGLGQKPAADSYRERNHIN